MTYTIGTIKSRPSKQKRKKPEEKNYSKKNREKNLEKKSIFHVGQKMVFRFLKLYQTLTPPLDVSRF